MHPCSMKCPCAVVSLFSDMRDAPLGFIARGSHLLVATTDRQLQSPRALAPTLLIPEQPRAAIPHYAITCSAIDTDSYSVLNGHALRNVCFADATPWSSAAFVCYRRLCAKANRECVFGERPPRRSNTNNELALVAPKNKPTALKRSVLVLEKYSVVCINSMS